MKRAVVAIVAVLGLGAGIGYLVTGGGAGSQASSSGAASAQGSEGVVLGAPDDAPVPATGSGRSAPGSAGGSAAFETGSVPSVGPEIVKTAQISVQVPKGHFQGQFQQATTIAGTFHGFVESSSQSQGERSRSGTLLIRVPSANFDAAMQALGGLGDIDSQSVSGQDVSSQFVDLEARLRTWEAQESVFIRLMHKANSINQTLQIQRQLQDVQMQIEQIKGELHQLHDQTTLATIDVTIHEPGVVPVKPQPVTARPSLSEAWSKALNGLLGVAYTVVVGLGYLLPVGALALLGVYVWRRVGVRPARPAEQRTSL
ncbi:MAG: DUF4349 domain-containing protein [Actinomycetota bacterium]